MASTLDKKVMRRLASGFDSPFGREYLYGPLLSAAMAGRDDDALRLIMTIALEDGVSRRTINEIILQSHLFLGFPAMIEASRTLAELTRPNNNRRQLPQPYRAAECRDWNSQGMLRIRRIYGDAFDRLVPYINSFSPQILTWMINDGYGRVLSRSGAAFRLRELSVVATLTVTAYAKQLKAHIRGALNFQVTPQLLASTIDNCGYFCSTAKVKTARKLMMRALET